MQFETKIMHGWSKLNKLSQNLPKLKHENIHQYFFLVYFVIGKIDCIKVTKIPKTSKWKSRKFLIFATYEFHNKLIIPTYKLQLKSFQFFIL
jgi:hypothetical protein